MSKVYVVSTMHYNMTYFNTYFILYSLFTYFCSMVSELTITGIGTETKRSSKYVL